MYVYVFVSIDDIYFIYLKHIHLLLQTFDSIMPVINLSTTL